MKISNDVLAVVGGGLAGIAAALNANKAGRPVLLLESLGRLGGRAASFRSSAESVPLDAGQHLFLSACSSLRALHAELGLTHFFDRQVGVRFLFSNGRSFRFAATPLIPGSARYLRSLAAFPDLSFKEKFSLARTTSYLTGKKESAGGSESFGEFLTRNAVSPRERELFWNPIVLSALGDLPEFLSAEAVRKVIRMGIFTGVWSRFGLAIPNRPLSAIYHEAVLAELQRRGILVRFHQRVVRLRTKNEGENLRVCALTTSTGETIPIQGAVLAVPPSAVKTLLQNSALEFISKAAPALDRYLPGAITAVHLRFDRRLILEHAAVLTGGPGQWLFCPTNNETFGNSGGSVYHQVLISGSHRILTPGERRPEQLTERVVEQLRLLLPKTRAAVLRSSRVTTVPRAIWLSTPEQYGNRPGNRTEIENLAFAGDWTDTGWPATLESAVRSGTKAVRFLPP